MSHHRIISHFEKLGVSPGGFDHFDYVQAFQQLPQLDTQAHPKKRKLAEEFASRCLGKLQAEERQAQNSEKCKNFIERMKVYQSIRQQKLEAMRYIEDKYDSKNGQLRLATQKGRFWKDRDGFEAIQHQSSISTPHSSTFSNYYTSYD